MVARKFTPEALIKRSRKIASALGLVGISLDGGVFFDDEKFDLLRQQDPEIVKQFLLAFYGKFQNENRDYFQNGAALGEHMNRLVNMPWFSPSKQYNLEDISEDVEAIIKNLPGIKSIEIITNIDDALDCSWVYPSMTHAPRECLGEEWSVAYNLAYNAVRNRTKEASLSVLESARTPIGPPHIWSFYSHAPSDCAMAALHILTPENMPKIESGDNLRFLLEDPHNTKDLFFSLAHLYEKGLWPAGIPKTLGKNEFWIYHPAVKEKA